MITVLLYIILGVQILGMLRELFGEKGSASGFAASLITIGSVVAALCYRKMFNCVRRFTKKSAVEFLKSNGFEVTTLMLQDCRVAAVIRHPMLCGNDGFFITWSGFDFWHPFESFKFTVKERLRPLLGDPDRGYIMTSSGAYFLKKTDDLSAIHDRILERLEKIQHNQAERIVDYILSTLD